MLKDLLNRIHADSPVKPRLERLSKDIVLIEKDGRIFYILYSRHAPRDPETIPANASAIDFEGPKFPWDKFIFQSRDGKQQFLKSEYLGNFKDGSYEYMSIFSKIEEARIPITISDVTFRKNIPDKYPLLVAAAEAIGGSILSYKFLKNGMEKTTDRRDFLVQSLRFAKNTTKFAEVSWFFMPLVEEGLYYSQGNQGEFIPPEFRDDLIEKTHPEVWWAILSLRNLIHAHKLDWVHTNLMQKDQNLVKTVGAAHTGIEGALLKSPEERLKVLEFCRDLGLLNLAYEPESVYRVAVFTPAENGGWSHGKIYEIPELKGLFSTQAYEQSLSLPRAA